MPSREVRSWLETADSQMESYNEAVEDLPKDPRIVHMDNALFAASVALVYAVSDVADRIDDLVRKQH